MDMKKSYRIFSLLLVLVMVIGILPINAIAAVPLEIDRKPAIATRAVEPADWNITEKNQEGKNYWSLTHNNELVRVSGLAEPLKTPSINYNGYFTRPDGRTVLRLSYKKYDAATTGVWHIMWLKVQDELADLIDFNNQGSGIYEGISRPGAVGWKNDSTDYSQVTQFGKESVGTAGSNNVYSVNIEKNKNRGTIRAVNEIPINFVLKEGKTIDDVNKLGQSLIQMRLTNANKTKIYTDGNLDLEDTKQAYNSYTFTTTVGIAKGFDKGLIRYLESVGPHFKSGNSTIHYNLEQGYVEVRHHFNREARAAGINPNGFPIGYRQVVDKSFYDTLKPINTDGTVAYMYQMLSNGTIKEIFNEDGTVKEPSLVVPIKTSDLNKVEGDNRAFIQVVASDFNTDKQYKDKITSVKTSNNMSDIFSEIHPSTLNYGHGIIIRYYVDKEKLANTFAEGNNLSHSAFYSTFIYDNSKEGTDTFEFTLNKDVDLKSGDKIHVRFDQPATNKGWIANTAGQSKESKMIIYVDGPGNQMELRSNFKVDRGTDHKNYTYTIQNEAPMKLKKGTKLTLAVNKGVKELKTAQIYFNNDAVNPPLVEDTVNNVVSYAPLIPDWQDTLSAGTIVATDFKPEIDEIFTDSDKIEGSTYYKGAEIKMVDKNRTQTFEASKDQEKVIVGDEEFNGYRFTTPVPTDENKFVFPTLEKDLPIIFTNRDIDHMALESKPEVVEQVQTKVHFDLNGQKSKIDGREVIDKIAPLNTNYKYNIVETNDEQGNDIKKFEPNSKYVANGFGKVDIDDEGKETAQLDNIKMAKREDNKNTVQVKQKLGDETIDRTVINYLNHNGYAYRIDSDIEDVKLKAQEDLIKRQFPINDEVNLPKAKRIIGWTTVKLEDDTTAGIGTEKKTAEEKFYDLINQGDAKKVTSVNDWGKAEKEAYIFDELSPIDKERRVYAVYGPDKYSEPVNEIRQIPKTNDTDDTKVEFGVPIKTLDKVSKGSVYEAEKWNKDTKKWDKVGETVITTNNPEGNKFEIVLDPTVKDGDVIRIVSKEKIGEEDGTPIYASPGYSDGVTGENDNRDTNQPPAGRENVNHVTIDLKAPKFNKATAEDEKFRRFVDVTVVLDELPLDSEIEIEIDTTGKGQGTQGNEKVLVDTKEEAKQIISKYFNTIGRIDNMPNIWVTAKDSMGNTSNKQVDYTRSYQLVLTISDVRAWSKSVGISSDKANTEVTLVVYNSNGEEVAGAKQILTNANETVQIELKVKGSDDKTYRLKKSDKIVFTGKAMADGNEYTSNPAHAIVR